MQKVKVALRITVVVSELALVTIVTILFTCDVYIFE